MGNYPSHRRPFPVYWLARTGATVDDAPLPPKTAARTKLIRAVFLHDFGGRATITQVGDRADDLGLLDDFSTHRSAYEAIMVALRPITTRNAWDFVHRPAPVNAPFAPG